MMGLMAAQDTLPFTTNLGGIYMENINSIIVSIFLSVVSALIGLVVWSIQKKLSKIEKNLDDTRGDSDEYNAIILEGVSAALSVGIVTATALRDGHANGNMDKTLDEAIRIQKKKDGYLQKMANKAINHSIGGSRR